MKKAFVVGHPIAHSRSPLIHGYWLRRYGIEGSYEPIDVAPDDLAGLLKGLAAEGFAGGNVTIPHKEAAFRLSDVTSERARRIGAVNTLVIRPDGTIFGDNTDALGFVAHLDETLRSGWETRCEGQAVVFGAGGAARAIIVGLLERGLPRILVSNRTSGRARDLVAIDPDRITAIDGSSLDQELARTGLLINATSLGMKGHGSLEIDLDTLPADAAVADIVYVPLETTLLARAHERGLAVVDGLGMLLHQAVPGFEAWFGHRPSVTADLRELIVRDLSV